ncbi:transglycosylase family protein [Streptomyces sp. L7]
MLAACGNAAAATSGYGTASPSARAAATRHQHRQRPGFCGGLQFSAGTWRAYGGSACAATADRALAVRADRRGHPRSSTPGAGSAWPVCSVKAGANGRRTHAASSGKVTEKSTKAKTTRGSRPASRQSKSTKKTAPSKPASKTPDRGTNDVSRAARPAATTRKSIKGDTLSGIAAEHGTTWRRICTPPTRPSSAATPI